MMISKEFEPYQQKSTDKIKNTFAIAITLPAHARIVRLNSRPPKHKECLDVTRFMHQENIDQFNIVQALFQNLLEAAQV